MDELYEEDFAAPRVQLKEREHKIEVEKAPPQQEREGPLPLSYYLLQLEKAIYEECARPEVVLPYVKTLQKEIERGDLITLLKLLDEVEELLDLSLVP